MNEAVDKFASQELMPGQICEHCSPESSVTAVPGGSDTWMDQIDSGHSDSAPTCSGGVCSLSWKPLRPAA